MTGLDSIGAQDAAAVDAARARLAQIEGELRAVHRHAERLARETAWESPSAHAFQRAAREWTSSLARLTTGVEGLREDLVRLRAYLEVHAHEGYG